MRHEKIEKKKHLLDPLKLFICQQRRLIDCLKCSPSKVAHLRTYFPLAYIQRLRQQKGFADMWAGESSSHAHWSCMYWSWAYIREIGQFTRSFTGCVSHTPLLMFSPWVPVVHKVTLTVGGCGKRRAGKRGCPRGCAFNWLRFFLSWRMGGLGGLEGSWFYFYFYFYSWSGGGGWVLGVLIGGGGKGFVFLPEWVGSSL